MRKFISKENYYKMVKKVLKDFSTDYSRNYYENKNGLIIEITVNSIYDNYDNYDNETNNIIIYLVVFLPYVLFHMVFRDKQKVGKKVWQNNEIYYNNVASFESISDGHKIFYHKGLTE